jgi:cholesterol transport system auxiliary component
MRTARVAVAGALVIALAGCFSLGSQEPQRYYVLDAPAAKAEPARTARAATLLVTPTTASTFYDIQDIAYSRAPGARAYYQYHSWTDRPGRRVTELLVARLERDGSFKAVAALIAGVHGNYVLNTHLTEFYHDAASAPGSARVVLTAELVDPVRRVLLARRTFEQSAPAPTYDAPGAVRAFDQAVSAVLGDVSAWIDGVAPR